MKKAVARVDIPSTKPTSAKLGIKEGHQVCVLGSPTGFVDGLKPLPAC